MTRQSFRFTLLFLLICLSIPLTATAQVVDIPDSNLRALIEEDLGKAPGATITVADMKTLTRFFASASNISDLTGLEHATNLTWLWLGNNNISDISPLVANTGIGNEDWVALRGNFLNALSINTHIPALQSRGVNVEFDNIIVRPEDIVQTVDIPDPNLHAAIADARGKLPSDPITMADMVVLTNLIGNHANISDLTGLEAATNLTSLEFSHNNISDISSLAGLTNLTQLNLSSNSITDTSHLAGLTNLTQLELGDNSITDISPLAGLTNLTQLNLGDNSITDTSHLAGLTDLTRLWLNNNAITDISPLTGLTNLTQLWLNNNAITDISPLVENTGLANEDFVDLEGNPLNAMSINTHILTLHERGVFVEFDDTGIVQPEDLAQTVDIPDPEFRAVIENRLHKVSGDPITVGEMATLVYLYADTHYFSDLTGLEHATNLKVLNLQENSVSDISPLMGLTNLTELNLTDNRISDISPLAGLNNLKELNLRDNRISDVSPLAGLNNLIKLRLGMNSISDISDITGLTNLTVLDLTSTSISDISPVAGLNNLITLYLGGNAISDISPLAGLNNLTQLFIWENSISDISPLTNSTNLTLLQIGENAISDISPLTGLTNLIYLSLSENAISDISPLAGLNNLTELYLRDNRISDISPLTGLTNLIYLSLPENAISDISPLVANTRLGNGHDVNLRRNPLNFSSLNIHIPALQSRGVTVWYDDTVVAADVNGDGVVNILDLVSVAAQFGKQGQNLAEDVNGDGTVNILDLLWVAGIFSDTAAAPAAQPQAAEILTPAAVRGWLTDAKALQIRDPIMERGVVVLEQFLASLIPTETQLLPNYPNPFNPETWIPYHLAKDAFVTLTIYDGAGQLVRTIDVGHQTAATYESQSQAIYWDGRNQVGEQVASGVYFYHLSAGDYSATRKMLILK